MKYIIHIVLLLSLCACNEKTQENVSNHTEITPTTETASDAELASINLQTERFTEIDSSGILLFPLHLDKKDKSRNSLGYSKSSGYKNQFWNFIFYDGHTSQAHLLTENKILIDDYSIYKSSTPSARIENNIDAIFYQATTKDLNQNGKLDENDPTYLFISDKQGRNFRQLSPDNHDLKSWKYIESIGKIILTAAHDKNGDLKIDEEDEMSTFVVSLDPNVKPKNVFDQKFKKQLKLLYARDWKPVED